MKNQRLVTVLIVTVILAACGGGSVTLGAFPAITKTEGDAAFKLAAPSSASPAAFAFTSSDSSVASVAGNTVTVLLAGTSTISAGQPQMGSYNQTSTSAVLTVLARVCAAPTVRDNGKCVQPCVAPAVRTNGVCVAPAVSAATVVRNPLSWMPVSFSTTWDNASSFCANSTINNATGWRQPTEFELANLHASGAMNGQAWVLSRTWSSTVVAAATSAYHQAVDLSTGAASDRSNDNSAYVACVR